MSYCLKLWPIESCGARGVCINQTVCACEPGWSQSLEFAYSFIEPNSLQSGLCSYNEQAIEILYLVAGSAAATTLFGQLWVLKAATSRRMQFKTAFPLLCIESLFAFTSFYRYERPGTIFSGDHLLFAILTWQAYGLTTVATTMFMLKIMRGLIIKGEWSSTGVDKLLRSYKSKMKPINFAIGWVLPQLLWLSYFPHPSIGLIIFRLYLAFATLSNFYILYFTYVFVRRYYTDLELIARFKFCLTKTEPIMDNFEARSWVKHEKAKIVNLYVAALVYGGVALFLVWLPLVSNVWLVAYYSYAIPTLSIVYSIYLTLYICFNYRKKIKKDQRLAMKENITRNDFSKRLQGDGSVTRNDSLLFSHEESSLENNPRVNEGGSISSEDEMV